MEKKPFEIVPIVYDKGRDLHGLMITLKNRPGALASVTDSLAEKNVNILYVRVPPLSFASERADVFFAIDLTDTGVKVEKLITDLMLLELVENVRQLGELPGMPGFVFDAEHFPLTVSGRRAIVFNEPVIISLARTARERLGEIANVMLWYVGLFLGETLCEWYAREYRPPSRENLVNILGVKSFSLGWFSLDFFEMNLEHKKVRLRITGSWESEFASKRVPSCAWLRGIFSGFFGKLFEKEVHATEVKCQAQGYPFCEFVIE